MQITQKAIPPATTLARMPRQTTITIRLALITELSAWSGCRQRFSGLWRLTSPENHEERHRVQCEHQHGQNANSNSKHDEQAEHGRRESFTSTSLLAWAAKFIPE